MNFKYFFIFASVVAGIPQRSLAHVAEENGTLAVEIVKSETKDALLHYYLELNNIAQKLATGQLKMGNAIVLNNRKYVIAEYEIINAYPLIDANFILERGTMWHNEVIKVFFNHNKLSISCHKIPNTKAQTFAALKEWIPQMASSSFAVSYAFVGAFVTIFAVVAGSMFISDKLIVSFPNLAEKFPDFFIKSQDC